jgi:hypothetical protein
MTSRRAIVSSEIPQTSSRKSWHDFFCIESDMPLFSKIRPDYCLKKTHFLLFFQLVPLESEKELIINANRTMAEQNLQQEPNLIERRTKINDLSEEGKILCTSVQEKLTDMSKKTINLLYL